MDFYEYGGDSRQAIKLRKGWSWTNGSCSGHVHLRNTGNTQNKFEWLCKNGMSRTWEKFSSLPTKKTTKIRNRNPEKKTFSPTEEGGISGS